MKITEFLPLATDPKERKPRKPSSKKIEQLRQQADERMQLFNNLKSQNNG